MIFRKVKNYIISKGFKALIIKVKERLGYKMATIKYMRENPLSNEELERQKNAVYSRDVLISICVPVYNTNKEHFVQMLKSVSEQTYRSWELCIADGSAKDYEYIYDIIKEAADTRIKYKKLTVNKGIVANSNEAVSMAKGEYIALLDHDDVLSADALFRVREEIDRGADFIYSDEASFSRSVKKPDIIHFKPDYSIFNLRGNNYICHLSVFRKSLFDKAGGFRVGFDGSQDHDLILRMCEKAAKISHIPRVLYFWRIHKNSVAMDINAKPYCITTGIKAVEEHIKRMNINAVVESAVSDSAVYRVEYKVRIRPVVINLIDNIDGVTSEYIIVADRNLSLEKNAVNELAQYIQLENVGMVCGMVVNDKKIQCGGIEKYENGFRYENRGTNVISEGYMKRLKYAHSVLAVNEHFFAVKKSLLNAMGGFNEQLWNGERVIEMSAKMRRAGYEIVFNPYAVAKGMTDNLNIRRKFGEKIKEIL